MERTTTVSVGAASLILGLGLACIVNGDTTVLTMCGEEWTSDTEGAEGWDGQEWVAIKDANGNDVIAPLCLTETQGDNATTYQHAVYELIRDAAVAECQSRASIMNLTMEDCSSHVSNPWFIKDCARNVDDCDPGVADDGDTGGSDGDDDGFGDVSPEVDCLGNTCVLSDTLVSDLLSEPESTWDEEGYELELQTAPAGWEITGITTGTLADTLGFQNDDIFLEVDGIALTSFAKMLEAGTHANAQDSVRVKYKRGTSTLYKTFVRECDGYNSASYATYDWKDLSSLGTALSLTDDGEDNVDLPFYFQFYGSVYDEVWIGANGAIRFDSGDVHYSNKSIPSSTSTSPDIAVFWDDLNPSSGGDAYYYEDEDNARFVISWEGVPHYSNVGESDFQIHLYENGRIEFHWQDADFGNTSYDHAKSATIGIQDHVGGNTATSYKQITHNTVWETGMNSQARAFVPDCD